MFDGVEVGAVGRQIFERMPCAGDSCLGVLSFMEGGIIHHQPTSWAKLGQEIRFDPGSENLRIDRDAEQPHRQQTTAN